MNWLESKQSLEFRKIILENGCWLLKNNRTKYPCILIEGKKYQISRIVKKLYQNIEIKGCALHKCDNPYCWNPEHIFDGTTFDNLHDSIDKGRRNFDSFSERKFKTHCPKGHEHNEQNTYFYKRGNRINKVCKICSKEHLINRRKMQRYA